MTVPEAQRPSSLTTWVSSYTSEMGDRGVLQFPRNTIDTVVEVPPTLGKYHLVKPIGSGGMGVVYLARALGIPGDVAVKTLRNVSPEGLLRFKQEFRRTAAIRHPNLVALYELGQVDNAWFFSMEFVPGTDLRTYLWEGRAFPGAAAVIPRLISLLPQLLNALDALHGNQILHLDVKPTNVLVTSNGILKLLDFGLSESETLAVSGTGRFAGTPAYMAPEQKWGSISKASDCYALGATMFEAVTGQLPLVGRATSMSLARKHTRAPRVHELDASVPTQVALLIDGLLEQEPERRFTLAEVRSALSLPEEGVPLHSSIRPKQLLFGRDPELQHITQILSRSEHRAQILTLLGDSGFGKTSLLNACKDAWAKADVLVLSSRCFEWQAIPFKASDALVDQLYAHVTSVELAFEIPSDVALARQMFPVLDGLILDQVAHAEVDPRIHRTRAAHALGEVIARIAEHRPVVLCIDDVHWGDIESAEIVGHLMDAVNGRVALVCTSRPTGTTVSAFVERVTSIATSCDASHLKLEPLKATDSLALLRATLGPTVVAEERTQTLVEDARGVPLFLEQIARNISDPAVAFRSLSQLFELQRERLDPLSRSLLDVVSVASYPTTIKDILGVLELDQTPPRTSLPALLSSLQSACLIRCDGLTEASLIEPYHDRVRHALIGCVPAEFARKTHQKLAEQLEAAGEVSARVAEHWYSCEQRVRAAASAVHAGHLAFSALAFEHARDLFRKSFEWDATLRTSQPHTLETYAWTLYRTGRCLDAGTTFAEVAELERGDASLKHKSHAVEALLISGELEAASRILNPLLSELGVEGVGPSRWRAIKLVALIVQFRWRSRYASVEGRIDELALRSANITWDAGKALTNLLPIEGMILLMRSLLFALRSRDAKVIARGLSIAASGFVPFLEQQSSRLLRQAQDLVSEQIDPYLEVLFGVVRATAAHMAGDWPQTHSECRQTAPKLEYANSPTNWEQSLVEAHHTTALEHLGHMTHLKEYSRDVFSSAKRRGDLVAYVSTLSAFGFSLAAANDTAELKLVIHEMEDVIASWTAGYGLWHATLWRLKVLLAIRTGDWNAAERSLDEEWPKITRSLLLHTRALKCLLLETRAAVVLRGPATKFLRRLELSFAARRLSRQLRSTERIDAPITALVLDAAGASFRGQRSKVIESLNGAASAYTQASMSERSAIVQWQVARLLGDAERAHSIEFELAQLGVYEPHTWSTYRVPGVCL